MLFWMQLVMGLGLGVIAYRGTLELGVASLFPRDPEAIPRHDRWMTVEEQMIMSSLEELNPVDYKYYRGQLWDVHRRLGYAQDRLDLAMQTMREYR